MTELNIPTLRGDVRDVLIDHVKALPKPWPQMSEEEQEIAIRRATSLADHVVSRAVTLAASRGFEHFVVSLGKYTIGDSVEGKFSAPYSHELVEGLGTRRGSSFLLVPRDLHEFEGQKAPAVASPDQPEMFQDEFAGDPDDSPDFPPDDGDEPDEPLDLDEEDEAAEAAPLGASPDFESIREEAGLK